MNVRVGQGYDVHNFCEGDAIILGGVTIPYDKAFQAHSDGDVLIHALCDALLGALALGDIGKHFPDTDSEYANIDSRKLLKHVMHLIAEKGWCLINADCTIIAQAPKMSPHIESMRTNLSSDLGASIAQVSIKATTTEKLGFEGRKEGIAAQAIVLLSKDA
ncbi:MAG: 2-C-methyl-D-erythritol 2,4-cyclodiphosphate synthase [Thiotrichaceae bacterium]